MSFIANQSDSSNVKRAVPDAVDFDILLLGIRGTGVSSGCAVTESATVAATVDVAAGTVSLLNVQVDVAAQEDNAVTAANTVHPRIDLVSVNASGTVVVTAGTAAPNPVPPGVPATSVPLATISVPANLLYVVDAQITDKRVTVSPLLLTGTGTPENAVTAPVGTMYLDDGGGANTTLYVKESGAADTGWAAI